MTTTGVHVSNRIELSRYQMQQTAAATDRHSKGAVERGHTYNGRWNAEGDYYYNCWLLLP